MKNCIDCNSEFSPFPHNQLRCDPCVGENYRRTGSKAQYEKWKISKFKVKPCKDCGKGFEPTAPQNAYCTGCLSNRMRSNILKRKYGITHTDYVSMLESQGGVCKICGTDNPNNHANSGFFNVDHCHVSGKVRGLLCHNCNTGLGQFKDDISLMEAAIVYIKTCNDYP